MPRAAVLGTGLIGASVGIALRGAGWSVVGWDPAPAASRKAGEIGAIDRAADSLDEAISGCDLVVLAGPVRAIVETLGTLETEALVTDVAGVKQPVVDAASHLRHFVGGHPMAGRETSGPDGASGSMFQGATWVLTDDGSSEADLEQMIELTLSLGAVPVVMDAVTHDAAVAAVSHLPHLTASALVASVARSPASLELAAGGFRDLTRIAMSDPRWWVDVLTANQAVLVPALRSLIDELERTISQLEAGDAVSLAERLEGSRAVRSAMAPPVATVGVIVEDRPGEIARVGHALSESGVDLRDLQLRHATHGGGGVLTLSVRAGEAERLRSALLADGFRLVETR